jgi:hypothetical protein
VPPDGFCIEILEPSLPPSREALSAVAAVVTDTIPCDIDIYASSLVN